MGNFSNVHPSSFKIFQIDDIAFLVVFALFEYLVGEKIYRVRKVRLVGIFGFETESEQVFERIDIRIFAIERHLQENFEKVLFAHMERPLEKFFGVLRLGRNVRNEEFSFAKVLECYSGLRADFFEHEGSLLVEFLIAVVRQYVVDIVHCSNNGALDDHSITIPPISGLERINVRNEFFGRSEFTVQLSLFGSDAEKIEKVEREAVGAVNRFDRLFRVDLPSFFVRQKRIDDLSDFVGRHAFARKQVHFGQFRKKPRFAMYGFVGRKIVDATIFESLRNVDLHALRHQIGNRFSIGRSGECRGDAFTGFFGNSRKKRSRESGERKMVLLLVMKVFARKVLYRKMRIRTPNDERFLPIVMGLRGAFFRGNWGNCGNVDAFFGHGTWETETDGYSRRRQPLYFTLFFKKVKKPLPFLFYGRAKVGDAVVALGRSIGLNIVQKDDSDADFQPEDYALVIPTPGVPPSNRAHSGDNVLSELDFAYRYLPKGFKVVSVTGTDGKSTTAWMLFELFRREYGDDRAFLSGNFEIPFSETVRQIREKGLVRGVVVVECSSFMLHDVGSNHSLSMLKKLPE